MATTKSKVARSSQRKSPTTLDQKIKEMGDHLLGIWRFREKKKSSFWCVTFVHDGYYYDLQGTKSIDETLDLALKRLNRLKK